MNTLRESIDAKSVKMSDFKEAATKIGPSVSPDMETWYKTFIKHVRRSRKPTTPVA